VKLAAAAARRFLSAPDKTIRAILLHGPNRALIHEGAAALVAFGLGRKPDPFSLTKLSEDDLRKDKARLADALRAQSLLGGDSVLWLRMDDEGVADQVIAALKQVEAEPASHAYWVIESGDIGARARTVAAFEAAIHAASIALYEETEAERTASMKAALQGAKLTLTPDAIDHFIANAPVDRSLMRGEIEKLALFAHGLSRALDVDDLVALAASEDDSQLDAAALAAVGGKGAEAMELLETHQGGGVSSIKTLERRILRVLEARKFVDDGVPIADAGDRLKPKVFWKERDLFAGHVRRWSAQRLRAALAALWDAEVRSKRAGAPAEAIAADAYRRVAAIANQAD
jgi:DNA polymerase-3 subunit delta